MYLYLVHIYLFVFCLPARTSTVLQVKVFKGNYQGCAFWNWNPISTVHIMWVVVWIPRTCQRIVYHCTTFCKKKKCIIINMKLVVVLPTHKKANTVKNKAINKKDDHHRQFGGRIARVLYKVHHISHAFNFLKSKTDFDYVLHNE